MSGNLVQKSKGWHGRSSAMRGFRPGTAVMEFVMAIPMIAVVIGLTMYLGWSMMRKQRVVVADQYVVWKTIDAGQPTDGDINSMFLGLKADHVTTGLKDGPADAVNYWIDNVPGEAQILADELLYQSWLSVQNLGRQDHMFAGFTFPYGLGQMFSGDIEARTGRDGREFIHGQASEWKTLNNLYYRDLTGAMDSVNNEGAGFAQQIRRLLTTGW